MKTAIGVFLLAVLAGAVERKVTADGAAISYTDAGAPEKPAIVLIHGWACDSTFWKEQIPALISKYRVLAIDLPGHGMSAKPEVAYTVDRMAKAVDAMMQDAGVKKAVLAGHSMGGTVARNVALLAPTKVRALVLLDGTISKRRPAWLDEFLGSLRANYRDSTAKFIESMFSTKTAPELRERIKTAMLSTPPHVGLSAMENLFTTTIWQNPLTGTPALGIYTRPNMAATVQDVLPGAQIDIWEGYGHFFHMEDSTRFNRRLVEFLDSLK